MKIGIISDTHIPVNDSRLPEKLTAVLRKCDLVLHAGDLVELSVVDELKKICRTEAVCGNMDSHKAREALDKKKILNVEGKKICLVHGHGNPDRLVNELEDEFSPEKPDIIVFGHSHVPMNKYLNGILFFNPGSATDTIFAPYRSYGIIEIKKGKIEANIYKL